VSNVLHARVSRATLNVADVGPVELGTLGQNLLREAARFASLPHVLTEGR
jgi:hypothetical protein